MATSYLLCHSRAIPKPAAQCLCTTPQKHICMRRPTHGRRQVPVYLGPIWPTREFPSWALSPKPWSWKWANMFSYK